MKKNALSILVNVTISSEMNSIVLWYNISFVDGSVFENVLTAKYNQILIWPFDIELIKNYFTIFLSQLFLSTGSINLVCSNEEVSYYQEFIAFLYNARNYEEKTDYYPQTISFTNSGSEIPRNMSNDITVMNMISGGKDSLVSDLLLQKMR